MCDITLFTPGLDITRLYKFYRWCWGQTGERMTQKRPRDGWILAHSMHARDRRAARKDPKRRRCERTVFEATRTHTTNHYYYHHYCHHCTVIVGNLMIICFRLPSRSSSDDNNMENNKHSIVVIIIIIISSSRSSRPTSSSTRASSSCTTAP